MADHYVDSAAAGGGDGSYAYPWNSLTQVNAHTFAPGDNMWFKGNSLLRGYLYIRNSGSNGAPILYGAYGSGNLPKICGAELVTGWTTTVYTNVWQASWPYVTPRFVLFDGVVGTQKGSAEDCTSLGDWYWSSNIMYTFCDDDPDGYYVAPGVESGVQGWSITTDWASGKDYITLKDLHVYGAHNGPGVFGTRTRGWTLDTLRIEKLGSGGVQMRSCSDLTIKNCTLLGIRNLNVVGAALHGVYLYHEGSSYVGSNLTAYGNTINNWPTYGITTQGYSDQYRFVGVYVHDNNLSHNATGVYPGESDTGEIYNNICDDNLNPYRYEEEYGIAFETVSNFDVHHNTCTNGRVGFEMWAFDGDKIAHPEWSYCGQSNNNHVYMNTFAGNSMMGFLVYMGYVNNLDFHTNRIYGNHGGGTVISESYGTGTGNKVYNNSYLGNDIDNGGYADAYWGTLCSGWTFKNNILQNTNRLCLHSHYNAPGVHTNNCYYRPLGNVVDVPAGTYTSGTVTSWEPTAIGADPKYVSTVTPDLHLQAGSPCINAADASIQNYGYTDFDGNPIV